MSFHFIRKWVKLKPIAVHNQGKSLPNASFVSHTPSPVEGEGEEEREAEGADEDELHIVIVMALWSAFTFYGLPAAVLLLSFCLSMKAMPRYDSESRDWHWPRGTARPLARIDSTRLDSPRLG